MTEAEFIDAKQAAKLARISIFTLQRYCAVGKGPKHRLYPSGRRLFRKSDVETWLASLEVGQVARPPRGPEAA